MAEEFRVLRPYEYHCQLMNKGLRSDGRKLTDFRNLKLETDAIITASSSSLVKLGNTSLVCGCTTQMCKSKTKNRPENDGINLTLDLPPISSSPTGHRTQHSAQLLTKTLKNILDQTDSLDKQCLVNADEDYYWSVDVEVICLNYDGCLIDAALIAVFAALKTLQLKDETGLVPSRIFNLKSIPVCSSFALVGDHLICDPNLEEESVAQSIFSITVDPKANKYHINKVGGKSLDPDCLKRCISLAKERAPHIINCLDNI